MTVNVILYFQSENYGNSRSGFQSVNFGYPKGCLRGWIPLDIELFFDAGDRLSECLCI